jgi:hypothetical protein
MTIWHSIVMPDCHARPDWSARRVWSNDVDSLIDNVSLAGRAVGQRQRRPTAGAPRPGCWGHVPGVDQQQFQRYADEAKATCPVARALAGIPAIDLTAKLAGGV